MDRYREGHSDPESQRNSHSDDSVSNHHHDNRSFENQRRNSSGDNTPLPHHERYHRRHHHSSNAELNDSPGTWEDSNYNHSLPLSGRKRHFSHLAQGTSSDYADAGSIVKLYVGEVPRTASEKDIRSVFGEHGNVVEVVLIKDKWTGQQQEWCFVKYATQEEAHQVIRALHGRYTFPGGVCPIKVRYADGERERLGSEPMLKLYVGCMNKQASKREIEEIFSPHGIVEDIYIVRDEMKQQRGCAFVRFSNREMAISAINALHGTYIMRGCEQPLIVRFADPKKPRGRDSRAGPYIGDRVVGHDLPSDSLPSPHTGNRPQSVSCAFTASKRGLPSSSSSSYAASTSTELTDYIDCDWSEHMCPDGYPYYYNCVTSESRWDKPEEYILYERQLLKLEQQQEHISHQQVLCSTEVSQA